MARKCERMKDARKILPASDLRWNARFLLNAVGPNRYPRENILAREMNLPATF